MVIAIDGYSSCGKSTLAKDLAQKLGYTFVDSGAMYRAVSLYLLDEGIDLDDEKTIDKLLDKITIVQTPDNRTILNDRDVTERIRSQAVASIVSTVAAMLSVREHLVHQQRLLGATQNIVMDGRDIGTVVFPLADYKFFVIADLDVRTHRRHEELLERGQVVAIEQVKQNLLHRDHIDSTRLHSPLQKAEGAYEIDTTYLTREQQVAVALSAMDM